MDCYIGEKNTGGNLGYNHKKQFKLGGEGKLQRAKSLEGKSH
jgi:hypothetical protein